MSSHDVMKFRVVRYISLTKGSSGEISQIQKFEMKSSIFNIFLEGFQIQYHRKMPDTNLK